MTNEQLRLSREGLALVLLEIRGADVRLELQDWKAKWVEAIKNNKNKETLDQ